MAFISPAARKSFDHLFCNALQTHLGQQAADEVSVRTTEGPGGRNEQPRTLVLLTCASLRFKLVAVFQVVDEALAQACFGSSDGSIGYLEVLFERGNLCCGAMNRDLLLYVPHLGLSTPSMLKGLASKVLSTLQAEHVSHFAVRVNGDHVLDVSLCMHGRAVVDFTADTRVASAETGELELL